LWLQNVGVNSAIIIPLGLFAAYSTSGMYWSSNAPSASLSDVINMGIAGILGIVGCTFGFNYVLSSISDLVHNVSWFMANDSDIPTDYTHIEDFSKDLVMTNLTCHGIESKMVIHKRDTIFSQLQQDERRMIFTTYMLFLGIPLLSLLYKIFKQRKAVNNKMEVEEKQIKFIKGRFNPDLHVYTFNENDVLENDNKFVNTSKLKSVSSDSSYSKLSNSTPNNIVKLFKKLSSSIDSDETEQLRFERENKFRDFFTPSTIRNWTSRASTSNNRNTVVQPNFQDDDESKPPTPYESLLKQIKEKLKHVESLNDEIDESISSAIA
jgi:hypothetical protein